MNEHGRQARARGALLGQAVGDALGTSVEFEDAAAVAAALGAGPLEVLGGGPFGVAPGQVTDDTELALALARTLVREGRWAADAVAGAYLAWRASEPWDCGQATHQAFRPGLPHGRGLARRVAQRASATTQANGSLMRSSPLGVFGWRADAAALAAAASADSGLSHPHPVCRAACIVYTHALARAVRLGEAGPALFDATLDFARATPAAAEAVPTLEAAARALPDDYLTHQGWVRVALQTAFFHLRAATDFEAALADVVRRGGDTDTNACITGALLGAALGEGAVPRRWARVVLACRPARPPEYHCGDLLALAERLAEGAPSAAVADEVELEEVLGGGARAVEG